MVATVDLPAGHRSALQAEGQGPDVPAEVQDIELLAADVEHRGQVLVHQPFGEPDPRVHHAQQPVRAD